MLIWASTMYRKDYPFIEFILDDNINIIYMFNDHKNILYDVIFKYSFSLIVFAITKKNSIKTFILWRVGRYFVCARISNGY